tara:strand:+ start:422 stop:625 length:204 start_codon:yes stop_codon:yes gene_type:complete
VVLVAVVKHKTLLEQQVVLHLRQDKAITVVMAMRLIGVQEVAAVLELLVWRLVEAPVVLAAQVLRQV